MALHTTLARSASKHISSYGTILDRFLVSHTSSLTTPSSSSSSTSSSTRTSPAAASLFEPTKSTTTGCWAPPRYSLRRQAALVKEAALTNQLSVLPDGPRTSRVTLRLQRLGKQHAFEQTASQYQYTPQNATSVVAKPERLGERALKPKLRVGRDETERALEAARWMVKDVGPYAGRAKVFKGSRVDKDKFRRARETRAKLDEMKKTVKDWQSSQAEAKSKLKPGLPF